MKPEAKAALKERAIEELKLYWLIFLYLFIFLGAFTVYRRLVVAEVGAAYLNYGFALIEALIIAKVILIAKAFSFTRRYEDKPLIVPTLYKALLFGAFVLVFALLEHVVKGWFQHEGLLGGLASLRELGAYEIGARALMIMIAFVPFFAFWEIGRVIGPDRLTAMFFSRRPVPADARPPGS
jgi:hypothetical protein